MTVFVFQICKPLYENIEKYYFSYSTMMFCVKVDNIHYVCMELAMINFYQVGFVTEITLQLDESLPFLIIKSKKQM